MQVPGAARRTYASLWGLVERMTLERPRHVLLADDHGRSLTVSEFRDRALDVAAGLRDLGMTGNEVVSWQLPTTIEAAVLMAALSLLGVTQNPLIPALRRREVDFITEQVDAAWLVVPASHRGFDYVSMANELATRRPMHLITSGAPATTGQRDVQLPHADGSTLTAGAYDGTEVRWLFYSSGTSAQPKGSKHSDTTVIAAAQGLLAARNIMPDDVYPVAFPIGHIGGVVLLVAALTAGARLVLFDTFDSVRTPERMAAHGATILGSAATFLQAYAEAQRHAHGLLFPDLRICMSGGAEMRPEVARTVTAALGGKGVVASYGLTEFPIATAATPDDAAGAAWSSVGLPSPGVKARVCGPDGADLPHGASGELQLTGPQCFLGYVDPALDRDARTDDGWLRTGDLATIDNDGYVRIVGRLKDIVIRNAENISAAEVEEFVLTHDAVADVAVLGVPDEQTGERVCAVVVLHPGMLLSLSDLVAHVRRSGLAVQKCPEQLKIVASIPRNSMGKVVKRELATLIAGTR